MPGRLRGALLVLALAAVGAQAGTDIERAGGAGQVAAFDAAFDDAFARYRPPGMAVGIVIDGEIAYVRTQGELRVGTGEAIDRETLFKIASNSKAMTGALLARLVDQGKLAWNDPVVKHLPDFRMHEDWVTREIQVRDLLIHNSGLGPGAGDLMLWPEPNAFTRAEVIHGLRHLKPVDSFRSRYAYDNSLYIVAGEVAAAAGGAPYDVLIRREVFAPLGMSRCQVGSWQRDAVGNVAQPHMRTEEGGNTLVREDGEVIPDVPMMAAGGIRCGLDDMLRWVQAWLHPERIGLDGEGRPWLSARQRAEAWTSHTPMPLSARMRNWDNSHFSAYGYGWRLTDVDGSLKVSHTGTLSGMYSAVTLLPEQDTGFVLMVNGDGEELRTVLTQVLAKRFTRPDAGHAVEHYASLLAAERKAAADRRSESGAESPSPVPVRRSAATPGAMAGQLGRYRDPWFGDVLVCAEGRAVRFRADKSPRLAGQIMRSGDRLLVDWDLDEVDVEPWLFFSPPTDPGPHLRMARIDLAADFSYDYQDLAFERVGDCP